MKERWNKMTTRDRIINVLIWLRHFYVPEGFWSAVMLIPTAASKPSQWKVIIGLSIGCAIGLFILAFIFIEPLRDSLELLGIGAIIAVLGVFNLRGNIGSIHWYNRRKVSKEDQLPYCWCVGLGTLLIGAAMIVAGVVQALVSAEAGAVIILIGIIIGLVLILYAQFKYNKGIFG